MLFNACLSAPCMVPVLMNSLSLSEEDVWQFMGYGTHVPDDYVVSLVRVLREELNFCCHPCYGYVIMNGEILNKESFILRGQFGESVFHAGKIITNYLQKSEYFLILVATVGSEFDTWREHVAGERDMLREFVADALGSALAEALMVQALRDLAPLAESYGMRLSNSYSPGYCGWSVAQQQGLFSLLPEQFCGISLIESSLMIPIKSVSAVVGMGSNVNKKPYGCAICRKKDCYKRRLTSSLTTQE